MLGMMESNWARCTLIYSADLVSFLVQRISRYNVDAPAPYPQVEEEGEERGRRFINCLWLPSSFTSMPPRPPPPNRCCASMRWRRCTTSGAMPCTPCCPARASSTCLAPAAGRISSKSRRTGWSTSPAAALWCSAGPDTIAQASVFRSRCWSKRYRAANGSPRLTCRRKFCSVQRISIYLEQRLVVQMLIWMMICVCIDD
mmetsp:Transcript_8143/g.13538  ORF Transcript_8143/g.13538 Transcript_8143/m.13538 type:complete len:200 (-) Transcript_8143:660-1259(-)